MAWGYGYLYAQTFAADIWASVLALSLTSSSDAFRQEGGTKIWKEMLIHGGAKDLKEMIHAFWGSSSRECGKKQENERELGLIKCC